jgi:hypothetical protein
LQARIPRYFPWQFGVDFDVIGRGSPQDIFDAQLDVRELLRSQQQTEWVISTGMFMSYLFEPEFGVVDLQKTQSTPWQPRHRCDADHADIGAHCRDRVRATAHP